jgi:PilZ domain
MSPPMIERRKHDRLTLRLPVRFSGSEQAPAIGCFTENISGGGFYCLSPTPFAADERREAHLLLPTRGYSRFGESVDIKCDVRVIRIDGMGPGRGFGVACQIERYTFLWDRPTR